MNNYQKEKAKARDKAIEWQSTYCQSDHYMSEWADWGEYWQRIGKRYGLLKEFRENGVI